MKKAIRSLLYISAAFAMTIFTGCTESADDPIIPGPSYDVQFYGLTSTNGLVKYNANNPSASISTTTITGLNVGDNLIAIDFRPATGQLYGLGSSSRIYTIHTVTGVATPIGTPFAPLLTGTLPDLILTQL